MPMSQFSGPTLALAICAAISACGSAPADLAAPTAPAGTIPATAAAGARLLDWPEFGLNPQRSDASSLSTGITSASLAHLRRATVSLPGTVDSSPVYVHQASVAGGRHNAVILTTSYGKTLAIDAGSGRVLWTFTPRGYFSWAGSSQITNTSPLIDPDLRFVYAASPNGQINKLSLAGGHEVKGWPVSVTRDPTHEKLGAALNFDGSYLLVATSGYLGDAPPYQGHLVAISRSSGRVASVFNTLCANRRAVIVPSSCSASDSAILSRGGAVVEPGGGRLLISTGNGPWNGGTNLGDSVIELTLSGLRFRQAFTPTNQAELNESDSDLGSSAPALLGEGRVLIAGKDGIMRILSLSALDGHSPARPNRLGGEIQRLALPGGGELFTAPAVWTHDTAALGGTKRTTSTVFVGDEHATAAYTLSDGRLRLLWQNANPGTSPVMAGNLLYVFDPSTGGINVYQPDRSVPIAKLPGSPGHWNSPIVVDGHIVEPEGNANDHSLNGMLDLFSAN
jgi:outer membrane protein assembly factor BamB